MKPFIVKRFNTGYAPKADRIVLTTMDHDDQGALIALHPNLLSKLIVKLCHWLDTTAADSVDKKDNQTTPILKRQAINVMAQSKARVEKAKSKVEPVPQQSESLNLSPQKLHLKLHDTGYLELQFEDSVKEITAIILMQKQIIRQWLDILCRHWTEAGWDTSVWPDWLAKTSLTPSEPNALH